MQRLAKKILKHLAEAIPFSLYRFLAKKDLIVLCYHIISDEPICHIMHYDYKTTKAFENDIVYLKRNFNLISYKQLIDHISLKAKIGNNSVLLSFDDTFSQCFSVVRPILLKHKAPCVFFITTDFMDNKRMFYENKISLCINALRKLEDLKIAQTLSNINSALGQCFKNPESFIQWIKNLDFSKEGIIDEICKILELDVVQYLRDHKPYLTSEEIKILASDGFTIGAHGKKHIRLDLLSEAEAEREIVDSCKIIMDLLGVNMLPFAFPCHGKYINSYFLNGLIAEYKFIDLFFDSQGLREDADFIINRVWVDSPAFSGDIKSNIPKLLLPVYADYLKYKYLNR